MTKENMQKYCTKCGKEMSQDGKFCVNCDSEIENVNSKHIKKHSNSPEKNVAIIVLICIIVFFVLPMLIFINTDSPVAKTEEEKTGYMAEKYKDVIEKNDPALQKYRALRAENNTTTKIDKCSGQNNLTFLEKSYKLYDLYNYDNDIKLDSNEMKIYGILKNNSSECSAKNIKLKVLLKRGENVMQEVNIRLKDVIIYADKTGAYSEKFEVYESLLDIEKYRKTRQLKSDIKASIVITSVNEPLSDFEKKYLNLSK